MTKKNLYAVILAGGSGTRFWPLSRQSNPKQFLNITGRHSLLKETLYRLKSKVSGSHIYIVTNKDYKKRTEKEIAGLGIPKSNILLEPKAKNTAASVCWAASAIYAKNKNAVMAVLPSDHLILNNREFQKILSGAVKLASRNYLVTVGIVPNRPETGYGYLKTQSVRANGRKMLKVRQFVEKPNLKKAKTYVKNKNYFWNSGMFIWKCAVILEEFDAHLPKVSRLLKKNYQPAKVKRIWPQLPNISVDYGIMEHSKRVVALPGKNIGWTDLGSFESLMENLKKDKKGNLFKGDILDVGSSSTLVLGKNRLIATIGLKDIFIIDTPDALLVCRSDSSQKVKDLVTLLKKRRRKRVV